MTVDQDVLHVRLLGELDLRMGDSPLPPLGSARAESLLAYLLLHHDAPQPRRRLAFVLWPDSSESQAQTNLRHVLHNLRRALPDADRFIDVRQRTLRWRPDAPCRIDVEAFERAAKEGRLEDAVEAYAGDLLESSYDDWLLEERERLARLHVEVLERLVRRLEEERRWTEAVRHAERLLRRNPLREESYRVLMRLYDGAGDRARALRVYHECEATLQRELAVKPAAATREAYEALLPLEVKPLAEPRPAHPPAGPALVGRAVERARLTGLWRAAEHGDPRLVLVSGEPGVGKSRLVEELRAWCAHRGAATAEARAYPTEGALAYGGVVAWLRSDRVAARLRRLERIHLTELARLLPELLVDVPDLAAPEPLTESEQRHRLFDAAARAVAAAGPRVLLVADDLQWFDAQTLQFVHFLLRTGPERPLLVAATARREEIDASHAAAGLVTGAQALERFSEIPLSRLSREETRILAERVVGRSYDDAEADHLYRESEGNPLFVIEALRAAEQEAAASPAGPSRAQAVIAARLARLSEPAAELLGVAAAVGREFTTQVLADASDLGERELLRGLDELWRRGIVRARGPGAYDFSHGKLREAALAALGPAHARHHQLRIAQALERAPSDEGDRIAARIAAHYDRAGEPRDAVTWYLRGAADAQRLHANADAVRALERALELVRDLPAGPDRDSLELRLLTALPVPLVVVEGYLSDRVAKTHDRARQLTKKLGVEPDPPLVRSLALASLARGEFEAARSFGEQIRARARRQGDEVLWVESAYVLGITAYWQGQLELARSHFEDAIARCRPEDRAAHLLHYAQDPEIVCLTRLAHTLWLLGLENEAGRRRTEGLELAEARGHRYSLAVAIGWSAMLALDQRDPERLRAYAHALRSDHPAHGVPQIRILAEALAGLLDVVDGRTRDGSEAVRRVVDAARRDEPATPGFHPLLMRILLETYALAGAAEAGVTAADEALGMGRGAQLWEAETRRLRAAFLVALRAAPGEVEAELGRAIEVAHGQGARAFERRARADLARLTAGTP